MRITFDPAKQAKTLADRGLNFEDAEIVFAGVTFEIEDKRKDYGETRIICYGMLASRMVVVGYTPRGNTRHIFSMRRANEREKERIAPHLEI
ncbi:MAG: BrnT family toxin [Pseudomonadota bacterium]